MSVFAELPDGRKLEFPDGTTAEVMSGTVKKVLGAGAPLPQNNVAPKSQPAPEEKGVLQQIMDFHDPRQFADPEKLAAHPVTRFALGAAAPFLGLFQLGAHAIGKGEGIDSTLNQLEQMKHAGAEDSPVSQVAGGAAEVAGNVMSPLFLKGAQAIKPGERLLTRTAQGAGFGAAGGVTAPVTGEGDYGDKKLEQTAVGTVAGGVIPGAVDLGSKVARGAYHGFVEPWLRPAAIKGRAYLDAAGDKVDDVISHLLADRKPVAGSLPNAGEAATPAGRTEFSALQESARKAAPSTYFERDQANNAARADAIKEFAGTPAGRADAVAARELRAGPHYEAGTKELAPTSGLQELMDRPSSRAVLVRAERLAREKSQDFMPLFPNGLPRTLEGGEAQTLKLAFDDMIKALPKSSMDSAELNAIQSTRSDYLKWMEKSFPELATGRKLYKMTSQTINQGDVGAELLNRLTPALREEGGNLRSTAFANAIRDSAGVVKKATGEPRFSSVEDVLSNRQLQQTHGVVDDLARADLQKDMARRGAEAGPSAMDMATQNLYRTVGGKVPTFLNRWAMLTNAVIRRFEGKLDRKLAVEMAQEMLKPQEVAGAMQEAQRNAARAKAVTDLIHNGQRPAIAGAVSAGSNQGD